MTRTEFPASVRKAAWKRCAGRCEGCTAKLFPGKFAYDHVRPDGLEGEPSLKNCQVLCTACHHEKTVTIDRPIMQKADNIRAKHLGTGAVKKPWPKRLNSWGRPWPSRSKHETQ